MSELLKISELTGGYKDGVDILHGIDLTINEDEAVGIIGLNGSGKSTLGKAIVNMIPFRRGKIEYNGKDITNLSTPQIVRKGIAVMQQGGKVFPNLSIWENIELAFGRNAMDSSEFKDIQATVPLLRLSKQELQRKTADKLSGGQRHQLAFVMAIASKPKLVILDEPSAGLSPVAVEDMYRIIASIREKTNVSIILIEQNVSKAVQNCDRCVLLSQGSVVDCFHKGDITDIESIIFKK